MGVLFITDEKKETLEVICSKKVFVERALLKSRSKMAINGK